MPKIKDQATGEVFEGNKPFFMFYKHNFQTMDKLVQASPLAARLFFFLVRNMDGKNAIVVSQHALAEVLNVTRMSIYNATKYLVENKNVKLLRTGPSYVYCVNADIVWTQKADKKTYAKFEAAVYLTSSEQEEDPKVTVKTEFQKVAKVKKFRKRKGSPIEIIDNFEAEGKENS